MSRVKVHQPSMVRLAVICFFLLLVINCGPQKSVASDLAQTPPRTVETEPAQTEEALPLEEPETVAEPDPEPEQIPNEPEQISNEPEVLEPPPEPERLPQELLEAALQALSAAEEDWAGGDMDAALADLDEAYALILQIDTNQNPELLQEKEDVRYLISQRVVALHATHKATVANNSKSIPLITNKHVEREIKSFQKRERDFFISSYVRSGRYRPMIVEALRREGLPEELSWLPLIESGFKTNALSRARALGMWQFISSTGYRYGMERNQWVDERMDPVKSTDSAIRYLIDLHAMFGDWMSALAGYNCGEGRVMRAIKSQHINYLDNFWDLYEMLPRETARYVPRFLATLQILEDPGKYGFELPEPDPPMAMDTVKINRSVRLTDLDKLMNAKVGTFKSLNPELRFGATPDKEYELKVPAGSGEGLEERIAGLPLWEVPADSFVNHRVRRGESLSTIAQKYRTSVKRIMRANNLRNANRIWPGQKLKIPGRAARIKPGISGANSHRVVAGDSLWEIAKKYKTSVGNLRDWNKLNGNHLALGQVLFVKPPQKPELEPANARVTPNRTYKVRRGDTLGSIAKRHGVSLNALMRANKLSKRDKIFPNQTLVVPAK